MDFENKILSKEISQFIWEKGKTLGTAESCTGGRIAEAIILMPGASNYFKGGIVSYTNDVKEKLLGVSHDVLEEKTAVCEDVAVEMVKGARKALDVDYAISATGIAGPAGGTHEMPVGTIWLTCGNADDIVTMKLEEDRGRDLNLENATTQALQLFLNYLTERLKDTGEDDNQG